MRSNSSKDTPVDKSAQVDALFTSWISESSPGAAVLVRRGGSVLHKKGYGLADLATGTPIAPDTCFLLASITKQFTALAVMVLVERGQVAYDDPVTMFLPEFKTHGSRITVRHLLHHTSGVEDYQDLFIRTGKIAADYPRSARREGEFEPTAAETLEAISSRMTRFAPGDQWEYSNSGYVVLAQLVERVSGKRFSEFLDANVFRPLGMSNTLVYDETRPEIRNRARSYATEGRSYKGLDYTPLNAVYGQDNIYSTLDDLVKWYDALETNRLVSASTMELGFTSGMLSVGALTGYGFGWFLGNYLGLATGSHTGSWGGFKHFALHYPSLRFTALVLSNFDGLDDVARSALAGKIAHIYLTEESKTRAAVQLEPEALGKFEGRYKTYSGEIIAVACDSSSLRVSPAPLVPIRLIPESDVKFFVEDAQGDTYFFDEDETGNVIGFTRHLSMYGYTVDADTKARKID
ncbi:MAG TPA: serine hydrolase domain-containing protein [Blastocatellia bacterium]|nr:serine hydrolase domain-containing protein [Blastocatellia bacterium]